MSYDENMKSKKINPLHLDEQLCFSLYNASRLMTKAYDPLLKELNLTYPQYLVMLVLWENQNIAVKDISDRLNLDSGTLSPLLKKLQTKGFIEKTRLDIDERIVAITLTKEGELLQKEAIKIPEKMFCRLNLEEKEFLGLRAKIKNLISNLSEGE
jgi:DNA-binding MarR family transcriptional regulator